MQNDLFILHDDVVEYSEQELEKIETELYDLSDEVYNYVTETGKFVEEWNTYSDLFETEEFMTVFSCENVEINIDRFRELCKNKNVKTLAETLVKNVSEIYSILTAYITDETDEEKLN
jgi:hypothetical protein